MLWSIFGILERAYITEGSQEALLFLFHHNMKYLIRFCWRATIPDRRRVQERT